MEDWQKEYLERARKIALEQARLAATQGSEGGGGVTGGGWTSTDESIFNAYWDKIGLNEALTQVINNAGTGAAAAADFDSAFVVSEKDPAKEQYKERFGEGETLRMSVGRPIMYGRDYTEWALDPSKIIDMGDGRFIYDESNINQDVINRLRDQDSSSGLNITPAMGIGFVLTAGMLGNAFLGAEGLAGAGSAGGSSVGTAAADLGQGATTASLTAGGGATNIASTTAALGGGGGSAGSILGGAGEWFSSLSPTAQRAIMTAGGQAASAVMSQRRQESAQDFARQQQDRQQEIRRQEEERAAEERRVRGTPSRFNFNVTPRSGIVGSSMGG